MPKTIGEALAWHARHRPEMVAVIDGESRLGFAGLWERSCRIANALHARGVQPGDRVAILLPNGATYVAVYQAIALLGAAAVPLNYRFVASEIEYIVNHSRAKALILAPQYAATVISVRDRLTSLGDRLLVDGELPAEGRWLSLEEAAAAASPEAPPVSPDVDACFFQGYTSGTTGQPKGCVNPHRGFVDFFKRVAWVYGIGADDVEITPAPLFHEAPTLFSLLQIFFGGTVVTTADVTPANIVSLIERHRVTWGFMVPTMWDSLANSEEIRSGDVSSMRVLVSAGAPLLSHTKDALLEHFPSGGLNEFYGGTEVGVVTNLGPADQKRKKRSVGKPIIGYDVTLLDEERRQVPQGEVGEIFIRGPILIREYFENPEADKAARHGEWFSLGDVGRYDEEGFLYIVDRKKDMIITGGENVFPAEIERVIHQHPAVAMTAVVGIPDDRWGERILAAVVLKQDQALDEEALVAHCRAHLANFKVPREVVFLDGLPMSSFGKILRREVRAPYWRERAEQV